MEVKNVRKEGVYALAILGIVTSASLAAGFLPGIVSSDQASAIKQAIHNNDFNAWKNAVMATLTQENFDKLVQHSNAMTQRAQLESAIKQAFQNKDYPAYKDAATQLNHAMTEEQFNATIMNGLPYHPFMNRGRGLMSGK